MKNIALISLFIFSHNSWSFEKLDALLDGLHQDAHEGKFESYFDRYSGDAVFLGTDKTETHFFTPIQNSVNFSRLWP